MLHSPRCARTGHPPSLPVGVCLSSPLSCGVQPSCPTTSLGHVSSHVQATVGLAAESRQGAQPRSPMPSNWGNSVARRVSSATVARDCLLPWYAARNLFVFDDGGATHHPNRSSRALTLRGWRAVAIPNGYIPSLLGTDDDIRNHRLHVIVLLVPWTEPADLLRYSCGYVIQPSRERGNAARGPARTGRVFNEGGVRT